MKLIKKTFVCLVLSLLSALPAMAAEIPSEVTLFKNVNIFDGKNEKMLEGYDVLVVKNLIKQVGKDIPTSGTYDLEVKTGRVVKTQALPGGCADHYHVTVINEGGKTEIKEVKVNVIDGGGRTLMPGLIDSHYHLMLAASNGDSWKLEQPDYTHATMVVEANLLLQRGFTTIRDLAGPGFGIKKAIDEGMIPGPRLYLAGTLISQTSGHADRTLPFEEPRIFSGSVPVGESIMKLDRVVNGRDEMLAAVRQNLKQGATHIKICVGGGVYSLYDPLDVTEFTDDEIKAAVDAASDWGTYVTAHVYTPKGIQRGIENGLKCIEHGQLLDEKTAKMMADKGIFLVTQPFEAEENLRALANDVQWAKYLQVVEGWKQTAALVKKYNVKMGFGTDLVFSPETNDQQADFLARFSKWFSTIEMLRMITSNNAEILALSGARNPYQAGPLGVIEEGAYADIILVDGNPLDDVSILGSNGKNIPFVMKDGKIYKNTMKQVPDHLP